MGGLFVLWLRLQSICEGEVTISIVHAEALEYLKTQPDNSFDAFFADAPYGLSPDGKARTWDEIAALRDGKKRRGFMGRAWDAGVPGVTFWREVVRVLKPGAPILCFGGTRTYHRQTCALEDAGAEICDCLSWMYGSGMAKSYNISKGIDDAAGATREVVGVDPQAARRNKTTSKFSGVYGSIDDAPSCPVTAPATDDARAWDGYGTGLSPSWEPCVLACKPFDGTIVKNAKKWGVGGLWIQGCRLPRDYTERSESWKCSGHSAKPDAGKIAAPRGVGIVLNPAGGWPPNVMLDEVAAAVLDEQSGTLKSGARTGHRTQPKTKNTFGTFAIRDEAPSEGSAGGASRFMYVAKVSRLERDLGCEHLPLKSPGEAVEREEGSVGINSGRAGAGRTGDGVRNNHPCLKPIALTQWLATLILPPAQKTPRRLLNVFAGSGSEAIGAYRAGWDEVVCIEREAEYIPILEARIARWSQVPRDMSVEDVRATAEAVDPRQASLFDLTGTR